MTPRRGGFFLQAIWASLGQLFQALLALAGLFILVRLLGPEAYGIYALALVCVGLCEIVVGGSSGDGIVSLAELRPSHTNSLFYLLVTSSLIAGTALWAGADLLAATVGMREAAPVLAAISGLPLLTAMNTVPAQLLVRDVRFSTLSTSAGIGAIAATLAGIYLAIMGWGVFSLVLMEYIRRTLVLLMNLMATRWLPSLSLNRADSVEIVRLALGRVENRALQYVSTEAMPRGLIGAAIGPDALGIYVIAKRLLDQLNGVLTGPISAVCLPAFALARGKPAELRIIMKKAIRGSTLLFWPALMGLLMVAPILLPLLFGQALESGVLVVQILILASLRTPLSGFTNSLFIGLGNPRIVTRLQWVSLILGALFLSLGVPYGITGASIALAARQWFAWPFGASAVAKAIQFPMVEQLRVLAQSAVPALIMVLAVGLAALLLPETIAPITELVILGSAGLIAYPMSWMAFSLQARKTIPIVIARMIRGDMRGAVHAARTLFW